MTALLTCFLLLVLAACGGPVYDCDLHEVASMPLEVQNRLLLVRAGINGKPVRFVVDTGAERTTMFPAAAERLGMAKDMRYVTSSSGVGGTTTAPDMKVDLFVLGETRFPIQRVAYTSFSAGSDIGFTADGLLGADILLAFDMDIDVPGHKLTLYRRRVCPRALPPWPENAIAISGVNSPRDRLLIPVTLDGVTGTAVLDTGAQESLIGPSMAARIGLTSMALAQDPRERHAGVGPGMAEARRHRFQLLQLGPVAVPSPEIAVLSGDVGIGDMLIGQDLLHDHKVWLSFRPPQMFISRAH